jgi:hypothetical protein
LNTLSLLAAAVAAHLAAVVVRVDSVLAQDYLLPQAQITPSPSVAEAMEAELKVFADQAATIPYLAPLPLQEVVAPVLTIVRQIHLEQMVALAAAVLTPQVALHHRTPVRRAAREIRQAHPRHKAQMVEREVVLPPHLAVAVAVERLLLALMALVLLLVMVVLEPRRLFLALA